MPGTPVHLRPVAPVAARVLLPGDPGRALALAQVLLGDDRRMSNHHRGLWGYTGTARDGEALTIQSTGLGGPSAAIVLEELAGLGATTAVRAGTATGLGEDVHAGQLVVARVVLGNDGTSRALGAAVRTDLDPPLAERLAAGAQHAGLVASTDLFYDPQPDTRAALAAAGALAVDLETAALAAVAGRHGVTFGSVLAVTRDAAGAALDDAGLEAAGVALGEAALAALAT